MVRILFILPLFFVSHFTSIDRATIAEKIEGLIVGSILGDAAGGPSEFSTESHRCQWISEGLRLLQPELKDFLMSLN